MGGGNGVRIFDDASEERVGVKGCPALGRGFDERVEDLY
jgi:hypothetical protein